MNEGTFTIERTFNAPASVVWNAITRKDEMKKWYFDLKEFKAERGFQFEFMGGKSNEYKHLCEVTDVVPEKRLTYSWRYEGYEGISFVTFELFANGKTTLMRLTHSGLDTFPSSNPDFAPHNFAAGWSQIVGTSLKKYLDGQ